MSTVTVVTAVRNAELYLGEAIESIRAQTLTDWEYVVVDDASEDGTVPIAEKYARSDARIILLRRAARGGPYTAANDGLRVATGRYVARLDADDVARPDRLEKQVRFLRDHPELRGCASDWRTMSKDGRVMGDVKVVRSTPRSLKWRLCVRQGLAHSTLCAERNAIERLGRYREVSMSQDLRLWCDMARRDWVGIVPEVLVHLRRPGSLTASASKVQEKLAVEALRDHLNALSRGVWSTEEVRALRPGEREASVKQRMHALRRWEELWRSDRVLDARERRELAWLAQTIRWEVLKERVRYVRPIGELLRAVSEVGRGIARSWTS